MIGSLKGFLSDKSTGSTTIDVGGVGYEIHISPRTYERLPSIGERVTLKIYTHMRENELSLFGFFDTLEKTIFLKLIKVNGIGPRLALNILSGMPPLELTEAIQREDVDKLTTIPGVGKKMATRIVIDLKDKLEGLEIISSSKSILPYQAIAKDVESALMNLGYSKNVAEKAVTQLKFSKEATLESLIRETLQNIAGARS
ncbi:MAG: Holliday junction DNA helicase RuvA [Deltaproteobacteria bacterium RIFCSPLOWO2_02_FULL_50_16]|nr:MAG: Holliday junction DNA helicase RuvA [Deltaproteobacteria bacterium GWA2_50_8]OGQ26639.1 MAG: Holliday junction DNA helicase RuvA [Deltaproteobacteria bacterium RIFCSPHIGHO2_02_FULL_50_15]OGQ57755.1 MAG: Holliday junction DNA helicase RuvA [Deltaproteobacteria bacterium RIFCSPLOWO2_02_FULL_50_16]OGQ68784.1 MAG: Holliday junction DNA helicase RuvA [Deltaproteobacteria bacterium RIFCSPLOWO2_12_FULL_50_11]